jgi:hypothetical protein
MEPISMTTHQLLNPQDHGQLRLSRRTGMEPHFAQIVPSEFVAAAIACPILFSKDPATGAFYAGAVLGLKPEEGALKTIEERGGFEPLSLQRDGFSFPASASPSIAPIRDSARAKESCCSRTRSRARPCAGSSACWDNCTKESSKRRSWCATCST